MVSLDLKLKPMAIFGMKLDYEQASVLFHKDVLWRINNQCACIELYLQRNKIWVECFKPLPVGDEFPYFIIGRVCNNASYQFVVRQYSHVNYHKERIRKLLGNKGERVRLYSVFLTEGL